MIRKSRKSKIVHRMAVRLEIFELATTATLEG